MKEVHAYLQFFIVVTIQDPWDSICKKQKKNSDEEQKYQI